MRGNLKRLFKAIERVEHHFRIWRFLRDEHTVKRYDGIFFEDKYGDWFLQPTRRAHLVATVVELAAIHDDKNCSVYTVLRSTTDTPEKRSVSLRTQNIAPSVRKLMLLRNNVYAHKSLELGTDEAFQRAGMTPNDLWQLIEETGRILQCLHEINGYGKRNLSDFSEVESTVREVLDVLSDKRACSPPKYMADPPKRLADPPRILADPPKGLADPPRILADNGRTPDFSTRRHGGFAKVCGEGSGYLGSPPKRLADPPSFVAGNPSGAK